MHLYYVQLGPFVQILEPCRCRYATSPLDFHITSSSIRHSFTLEDLVSAPNLELGCAVILHNCASDYIQTVLVV